MLTQSAWSTLTPIFDTELSCGHLIAQGEVFAIVNYLVTPTQLDAPHWHDTYEIGYVRQGTGIIVMGQRVFPYRPGQVCVINDLEPHRCYSGNEETHLFVVHFHPNLLESGWIGQMHREIRVPFLPHYGQDGPLIPLDNPLTTPIRSLREEEREKQPLWDVIASGLLLQAVGRNLGVIFITHNPHHAYPIGDHFTILNRGRSYGTFAKSEISREELTGMMAGGEALEELSHELAEFARTDEKVHTALAAAAQEFGATAQQLHVEQLPPTFEEAERHYDGR